MKYLILFLLIITVLPVQAVSEPTNLEIEIHQLINIERKSKNRGELFLHSTLIDIARAHSEDMLQNNFFQHVNLDGKDPFDRIKDWEIQYSTAAENLYFASGILSNKVAESAVVGWIESEGHYENMLSETTYTGIGVAFSGDVYYVTQIFVQAVRSHLEDVGTIYDNNWNESDNFEFTATHGYAIFGLFLVSLYVLDKRAKGNLFINQTRKRR